MSITIPIWEAGVLRWSLLVPLAPLAAAVLVGLFGWILRGASHWPVLLGILAALAASLVILSNVASSSPEDITYRVFNWIAPDTGRFFTVSFRVDPLTAVMLAVVCGISLLVAAYSRDYMREHGHAGRGYERYFALISLFVASMAALVLAGNFLFLYVGWEAVGLCSYLLIGFYYDRPAAAAAARKAFLVNRIGDFGFGLGILCLYLWITPWVSPGENPLDCSAVFRNVGHLEKWQATTIALLLFSGAVGKSAQLPLHVWLPDAMEGPTPVSALIHAATMVTAGVYMVARCGPIFMQSDLAIAVVAAVGAMTALFAATIAVAQTDMKRILAYSTISQLGFMFLALGCAAADTAVFHLYTHAFFKALLFLGAGSVMHALGGIIDLREFSGLRRVMPFTYVTFLCGGLALAGFPFFSGFFSKDEIIAAAFDLHPSLGIVALATAALTAFYTFRMIFLAFHGPRRVPEGAQPHEAGPWMLIPLAILAAGSFGAGYVGVTASPEGFLGLLNPGGAFHRFLRPVFQEQHPVAMFTPWPEEHAGHGLTWLTIAVSLASIAAAYVMYARRRDWADAAAAAAPDLHQLLYDRYYVDELNEALIVHPLRRTGSIFFGIDNYVIDGILWAVAAVPRVAAFVLRGLHGGAMQGYGATMAGGVVLIVILVLLLR